MSTDITFCRIRKCTTTFTPPKKLFVSEFKVNYFIVIPIYCIFQGDDKDKKRPGSRGSAKSKGSQDKQEPVEFVQPSTPVQEEFWPVSVKYHTFFFTARGLMFPKVRQELIGSNYGKMIELF